MPESNSSPKWRGSTRGSRLPQDWKRRRLAVLSRDARQCRVLSLETGLRCTEVATEVDHINPGDNHDLKNLQAICSWHHGKKSSAEGRAARIKLAPRYRQAEAHPGLL